MKKPMRCDWCDGIVGKAYQDKKKAYMTFTDYEKAEIEKRKKEPIDFFDIQVLIGLSLGFSVFEAGGHPWMKNGGVVSPSSIYKLYGLGFTEMEFTQFTDNDMGRRWKLTEKGKAEAKRITMAMCHAGVWAETVNGYNSKN